MDYLSTLNQALQPEIWQIVGKNLLRENAF